MAEPRFNAAGPAWILRIALMLAVPAPALAGDAAGVSPMPDFPAQAATMPAVQHTADPEPWGPVQVVVYKSARRLALYRSGKFEREFMVVLGLQPDGRKRHAYDARTPEGMYRVIATSRHARWQYFVAIDYPNDRDRASYAADLRAGRIPLEHDAPFGIGSEIGIHGNDRPGEQAGGIDWTMGCVAMRADQIAEVATVVQPGTPVWIVP